jgi:hypothetical protein
MSDLFGHAPEAPVRAAPRFRLQRLADRARDFVVANLTRCAGPRFVVQTVHPAFGKALAPSTDGRSADTDLGCDLLVVEPARCSQHNARPLRQSLRRPVLARQSRQFAPLHIVEYDRNSSSLRHSNLLL